jgi:hypothetical protein
MINLVRLIVFLYLASKLICFVGADVLFKLLVFIYAY